MTAGIFALNVALLLRRRSVGFVCSGVSPPCLKAHSHWWCICTHKGESRAGYVSLKIKYNPLLTERWCKVTKFLWIWTQGSWLPCQPATAPFHIKNMTSSELVSSSKVCNNEAKQAWLKLRNFYAFKRIFSHWTQKNAIVLLTQYCKHVIQYQWHTQNRANCAILVNPSNVSEIWKASLFQLFETMHPLKAHNCICFLQAL